MAAPITHTVLAAKIFDKFFKDKTKKDFFIGTLFPDIRYLKVIERNRTHFSNLKIVDPREEDSFLAGVKFHSILDIAREKFIVANDAYSFCPKSGYIGTSLKILEDEIFYQHINDWNMYIDYLNDILQNEENFGIAKNDIQRWHKILQKYFERQPDKESVRDFALSIGFSEEATSEINENVSTMRDDKKIINILERLYKNFDALVT